MIIITIGFYMPFMNFITIIMIISPLPNLNGTDIFFIKKLGGILIDKNVNWNDQANE